MNQDFIADAIGRIYDCAIDAQSWDPALELLRGKIDVPFAAVHLITCTPDTPEARTPPEITALHTPWDARWVHTLPAVMGTIPRIQALQSVEVDEPVVHSEVIGAELYAESQFRSLWLDPQGLADGCTTTVLRRDLQTAMLSIPVVKGAPPPDEDTRELLRLLAPHFRRALLISDMLDLNRQRTRLLGAVLDRISVPVFLIASGARIAYANAAGEAMLAAGSRLVGTGGRLRPAAPAHAEGFAQAVQRACTGLDTDIGLWGNGIVLGKGDEDAAVAYVLPLGRSELRHSLGTGMAAVFVSTGAGAPPPVEVLTALSGLTTAEARVALAVADGHSVEAIASDLGVSLHTVRKHLSNAYDKTGARSQSGLGAFVNGLRVPLHPAAHG